MNPDTYNLLYRGTEPFLFPDEFIGNFRFLAEIFGSVLYVELIVKPERNLFLVNNLLWI